MGDKQESVLRQIAELEHMSKAQLKERWQVLFGDPVPGYGKRFMAKRLAYRIQELAFGGLSENTNARLKKALEAANYNDLGMPDASKKPKRIETPVVGMKLVREWKGENHEVLVLKDGFEYRNVKFNSLSAIAKSITGTSWNGPRFFGLRGRSYRNVEVKSGD